MMVRQVLPSSAFCYGMGVGESMEVDGHTVRWAPLLFLFTMVKGCLVIFSIVK
jgi:hypothetical protein